MIENIIIRNERKEDYRIYDDRLLVKKTKSALKLMPTAVCGIPYEGAKEMLLIEEIDDKEFLTKLFEAIYDELPLPKRKTSDGESAE